MKKIQILAFLNLLALAIHIAMAYMIQSGLINEQDTGQVADSYDSLFTPAEITFAVWGVIYTALLIFCIYHLLMSSRRPVSHHANRYTQLIGPWFILNNIAAAAWLFVWTKGMIATSMWLIFFQLITLIIIHLRAGIHDPYSALDSKIFNQFPLSIYFGWLTIAAIANIHIYLIASGWNSFGLKYTPIEWTRIIIGIVVFLTLLVVFTRRNVFFGLVIIWALYGIILKRRSINPDMYKDIIETAWIGLGIVAVSCIIQFILNMVAKKELPLFPEAESSVK